MKRILKLQNLIKKAKSIDIEKDIQNFEKAKSVAENKIALPVPGVEELKEMEAMAKKILSNDTIANPSGKLTKEQYSNLKDFLKNPDDLKRMIKGGGQKEIVYSYFKKTSGSKIELEFSNFMFDKSLEYNAKRLNGNNLLALEKENFNRMLKDTDFLKSSGIIQYFEKASILKRANVATEVVSASPISLWSKIKSFGEHIPLLAGFYEAYLFLESFKNASRTIDFIKSEFSDISNSDYIWMPNVIEELIEENKFNSEKFLRVSLLNNTSKYLFEEGLETVFRALTTVLNFFFYFEINVFKILMTIDVGVFANAALQHYGIDLGISETFSIFYINNNEKIIDIANSYIKGVSDGANKEEKLDAPSENKEKIDLEQVTVF